MPPSGASEAGMPSALGVGGLASGEAAGTAFLGYARCCSSAAVSVVSPAGSTAALAFALLVSDAASVARTW